MKAFNKKIIVAIMTFYTCFAFAQSNVLDYTNFNKYEAKNNLEKSPKAVFYGNSITEGWVEAMPDFFTNNNYIGRGISGQTSAQLLLRFRQDVIDLKPKILVLKIGTNDVAENSGPYNETFTLGNIESMVEIAKQNKIKVILCSVLPAKKFHWRPSVTDGTEKILSLNIGIKNLAQKHKVTYLDYHTKLKNKDNGLDKDLAEDDVHPTLKCYELMAKMAQTAIEKL